MTWAKMFEAYVRKHHRITHQQRIELLVQNAEWIRDRIGANLSDPEMLEMDVRELATVVANLGHEVLGLRVALDDVTQEEVDEDPADESEEQAPLEGPAGLEPVGSHPAGHADHEGH